MLRASVLRVILPTATLSCVIAGCMEPREPGVGQTIDGGIAVLVAVDSPLVSIGVADGKKPYTLSGVSDATLLADGTIVVADCQSGELRYFDSSGRFVSLAGGRGNGPGEFRVLGRLFLAGGDSLGADDQIGARLTIFDRVGTPVRTLTRPLSGRLLHVIGRLEDGRFVGRRTDGRTSAPAGSRYRSKATLLILDGGSGEPIDSIVLPGIDMLAPPSPAGPMMPLRLNRNAVFAVGSRSIFYGGQDGAGIIEFDGTLNRVSVIEPVTSPEAVTAEVMSRFDEIVELGADIPRGGIAGLIAGVYPDSMPAFGDLIAGRDGKLWVQDPVRPGIHPLTWTAYEDGKAVLRAEVSPRFFPFEFGEDWVLGVWYDELSVEHVQLWRLAPGTFREGDLTPREAKPPTLPRCGAWRSR
jgi:hypothetical protein